MKCKPTLPYCPRKHVPISLFDSEHVALRCASSFSYGVTVLDNRRLHLGSFVCSVSTLVLYLGYIKDGAKIRHICISVKTYQMQK